MDTILLLGIDLITTTVQVFTPYELKIFLQISCISHDREISKPFAKYLQSNFTAYSSDWTINCQDYINYFISMSNLNITEYGLLPSLR